MKDNNVFRDLGDFQTMLFLAMGSLDIFYDNYMPFLVFLKNQGLDSILCRENLRLRERHTIVPHVCPTYVQHQLSITDLFVSDIKRLWTERQMDCRDLAMLIAGITTPRFLRIVGLSVMLSFLGLER
ncbi:hypothetical protein BDZ97DRAFT_572842 [Flammula alnicola]|nr:hypothetical protein BDZ97DRAFT_572842 [Flammula alnicola]